MPPRKSVRGTHLLVLCLVPTSSPMLRVVQLGPGSVLGAGVRTQFVTRPPLVLLPESGQPTTTQRRKNTSGVGRKFCTPASKWQSSGSSVTPRGGIAGDEILSVAPNCCRHSAPGTGRRRDSETTPLCLTCEKYYT